MRTIRNYFTLLLAAGAVAAAIAGAPTAAAAPNPVPSCVNLGSSTQCQSSGNVQVNDSPPIQIQPQYPYLGGFGIYHHRGPHSHGQ